jgi:hypothetical protein
MPKHPREARSERPGERRIALAESRGPGATDDGGRAGGGTDHGEAWRVQRNASALCQILHSLKIETRMQLG